MLKPSFARVIATKIRISSIVSLFESFTCWSVISRFASIKSNSRSHVDCGKNDPKKAVHVHHTLCYASLTSTAQLRHETFERDFLCFMEHVNLRRRNFLSLFELVLNSPQEFNSTNICQHWTESSWARLYKTQYRWFERKQLHFYFQWYPYTNL